MSPTAAETFLPAPRWRRNLISAALLFHIIVVPVGSYLATRPGYRNGPFKFLKDYPFAIGALQVWALFSPEPRREAIRYYARLTFKDGSTQIWRRPYPPKWDFFLRLRSYSFQKWDLVSNNLDKRSVLWPSLTHHLETLYRDEPSQLTRIEFFRQHADWPPPNPSGWVGGEVENLKWEDQPLFDYDVKFGVFK